MPRHATRHFDGDGLKARQTELGLTSEDLARRAGVTLRVVSRWRNGEGEPRGANLLSLSLALGCEPNDLYTEAEAAA